MCSGWVVQKFKGMAAATTASVSDRVTSTEQQRQSVSYKQQRVTLAVVGAATMQAVQLFVCEHVTLAHGSTCGRAAAEASQLRLRHGCADTLSSLPPGPVP